MTEIKDTKVLDKSRLSFKAGSFESISKTIDSKDAKYFASECTKIRDKARITVDFSKEKK